MIVCRLPLYNNNGTIGYFDYSACLYPMGQTDQQMYFFNEEDIEQTYFTGYVDADEEQYIKLVNDVSPNIQYPKLHLKNEE
jgi:hypothetical protein